MSKPAATPIGFGNSIPAIWVLRISDVLNLRFGRIFNPAIATRWASSGSKEKIAGRSTRKLMGNPMATDRLPVE